MFTFRYLLWTGARKGYSNVDFPLHINYEWKRITIYCCYLLDILIQSISVTTRNIHSRPKYLDHCDIWNVMIYGGSIHTSNWCNISYKVIWLNELVLIGIELKEKNYSVKKNHFSLEFDILFALSCRAHTSQDDNLKCEIIRAIHVFNFNASLHFSSRKIGRRFLILSKIWIPNFLQRSQIFILAKINLVTICQAKFHWRQLSWNFIAIYRDNKNLREICI